MTAKEVAAVGSGWKERMALLQPANVLELGTGQGASGALIMASLPQGSKFTTVNYDYPNNCTFGEFLEPWRSDPRLKILVADTLDPDTPDLIPVDEFVDVLFIDTLHEAWQAALELEQFQWLLADGAVVVVDDLSHNDMLDFWESVPYDKDTVADQGVFVYDASRPYISHFPRKKTPKEEAQL